MRLGVLFVLVNYVAFGMFIALRPSEADLLHEKDAALQQQGEFYLSSADPYTYLAARPLYSWSVWHGGEHPAVMVLEVANLPALWAAIMLTPAIGTMARLSVHYGWSYVRAAIFLIFATAQWLAVGVLSTSVRRATSRSEA